PAARGGRGAAAPGRPARHSALAPWTRLPIREPGRPPVLLRGAALDRARGAEPRRAPPARQCRARLRAAGSERTVRGPPLGGRPPDRGLPGAAGAVRERLRGPRPQPAPGPRAGARAPSTAEPAPTAPHLRGAAGLGRGR